MVCTGGVNWCQHLGRAPRGVRALHNANDTVTQLFVTHNGSGVLWPAVRPNNMYTRFTLP